MPELKPRWDIFCTVVDNFGDIGVTWRLARQLVAEHGLAVRLWVDDLRAFERICPAIEINAAQQSQQGVEVRHWPADWVHTDAADVVIAAFACQLPSDYMDAMAAREQFAVLEGLAARAARGGAPGEIAQAFTNAFAGGAGDAGAPDLNQGACDRPFRRECVAPPFDDDGAIGVEDRRRCGRATALGGCTARSDRDDESGGDA